MIPGIDEAREVLSEEHLHQKRLLSAPGQLVLADSTSVGCDLLIGVPPHRPPNVITASGLTGAGAWIKVDPGTLETGHAGVYAIGDVTGIKLANGLGLPKAGAMAELEGKKAEEVAEA